MENIKNSVIARLSSLKYEVIESDDFALIFLIKKATKHILNYCHIFKIPDELECVLIDMVVGEFLSEKKAVDPESLTAFDLDGACAKIQEGDTTVDFGIGKCDLTPEQRLDALIRYFLTKAEQDLGAFKCVKW